MTKIALMAAVAGGLFLGLPTGASAAPAVPSAKHFAASKATDVTFKRRRCDPGVSGYSSGFYAQGYQPYYSGFYGGGGYYGGGYYGGDPGFYGAPFVNSRRVFRDRRYWRTRRPGVGIGFTF